MAILAAIIGTPGDSRKSMKICQISELGGQCGENDWNKLNALEQIECSRRTGDENIQELVCSVYSATYLKL